MSKSEGWSPIGAVVLGVLIFVAGAVIVDLLVLQVYPLPPGLWGNVPMREIIATRPAAAVALNVAGQLVVLAAAAFLASRLARGRTIRAGALVTGVVLLLGIGNAVASQNFRWPHAVAVLLLLSVGLVAAKRGSEARQS
jgi:hypothetical protein